MTGALGVILAGGQATRMGGGDKGLLMLDGQTMLTRVMDRLAPQVDRMVLNANGEAGRFSDYSLPVIPDSIAGFPGPLAGVLAGMDHAAENGMAQILTVAADTPFFPIDLYDRLHADDAPIRLAATHEHGRTYRHPTFGLWPVALRHDLREALNNGLRKVVLWTDRHGTGEVLFAAEAFFNVNTPEDLTEARARLATA
ncbi:molybdenum cofactor guanylyltransferase MobA [Actibacterium sp. 188UL27-1]|uniref:molybdenum cofactor guanylyltransferase MobA n=1 Tax=Actibacterium sp. 188UL27-1 TaxID=2786961 RepID=UPI00195F1D5D|nr:molybdenum cofactor guanylyltransferase MobA [Actibacterium sp. 188UL27-1]MBM7068531.1 molybdenum cofactor guanylyltransferase MobA [Actibacterium sp. 188UL27-1]